MSGKYIMGLYILCLAARKEATSGDVQLEGFTEREYGMIRLENLGDVSFQTLLDNVKIDGNKIFE